MALMNTSTVVKWLRKRREKEVGSDVIGLFADWFLDFDEGESDDRSLYRQWYCWISCCGILDVFGTRLLKSFSVGNAVRPLLIFEELSSLEL